MRVSSTGPLFNILHDQRAVRSLWDDQECFDSSVGEYMLGKKPHNENVCSDTLFGLCPPLGFMKVSQMEFGKLDL